MVTSTTDMSTLISATRSTLSLMMKGSILIETSSGLPEPIFFHYNPESYTVTKSVSWDDKPSAPGEDASRATLKGVQSTTLSLKGLLFDTYEENGIGGDVRKYTNKLFKLVQNDSSQNPERPPFCWFSWGFESGSVKNTEFKAFVEQVSVTFVLFLADGTPCRAKVDLDLKQAPEANPGQNPTTQGTYGNKVHVVKPGESLSFIAYMYYRDPTVWRILADANRLHNPLDIRPGDALEIVPVE